MTFDLVVHIIAFAVQWGALNARVKAIEQNARQHVQAHDKLADSLNSLEVAVGRLQGHLETLGKRRA